MTDNEIIKALEACEAINPCRGCPYKKYLTGAKCVSMLLKDTLDLINRQKAEIERLNIEFQSMRSAANSYKMHYETAKSEAIKEFAERLKCGVPQETGVIRCADVENLVKEMTE